MVIEKRLVQWMFIVGAVAAWGCKESKMQVVVTRVQPTTGTPADVISIAGFGFASDAAHNAVYFDGRPAEVLNAMPRQLTVIVPHEVATGEIVVQVGTEAASGGMFVVAAPPAKKHATMFVPGGEQ